MYILVMYSTAKTCLVCTYLVIIILVWDMFSFHPHQGFGTRFIQATETIYATRSVQVYAIFMG